MRKLQVYDKRRCWGSEPKTSPVGSTCTVSLRFISSPASPSPPLPPQRRLTFPLTWIWNQPPSGLNGVTVLLASPPIHLPHWSQSHCFIISKCKLVSETPLLENVKWLPIIAFRIRFLSLVPKPCMTWPQPCLCSSLPPPTPVPISSCWLTLSDPQIQRLLHREPSLPGLGYCPFSCFTFIAPYFASWYLSHLVCIYGFLCLMPAIPLPPRHPDPGHPPVFHPHPLQAPWTLGPCLFCSLLLLQQRAQHWHTAGIQQIITD